jgi:hypothetical protein
MDEPQLWTDELAYRRVVLRVVPWICLVPAPSYLLLGLRLGMLFSLA